MTDLDPSTLPDDAKADLRALADDALAHIKGRESGRQPRFEVVRTHAGWHARFVAANGQPVFWTETYTRRRAALHAIELIAKGGRFAETRDVDERTS